LIEKQEAYLRYLTCSETDKIKYKRIVAIVKRETRKIKRQCWETFVLRIEHDLLGRQIHAYKIIKHLNRTEKDNLQINPITEHTWLDYYQKLWTKQCNDNTTEDKRAKLTENCINFITMEELETTIKAVKSRKFQGSDGINNEL
jgi:tRNA U55 pseudouridine synthase TruB